MKKILPLFFLLLALPSYGQSGEKNFIDQPYIEITGKAEMEITPDLFKINITLNENDTKNKITISELEQKMTASLTRLGIDVSKDLLVKDISSNFKKIILSGKEIILQKEFELTLRDPGLVGKTFIELEKEGISNVSIASIENSRITEYRKEVKKNAIKAAKEKAQYLAEAIDQSVGKALFVQEIETGYQRPLYSNTIYKNAVSAESNQLPELGFEKIKLEYSVFCKFELK